MVFLLFTGSAALHTEAIRARAMSRSQTGSKAVL